MVREVRHLEAAPIHYPATAAIQALLVQALQEGLALAV